MNERDLRYPVGEHDATAPIDHSQLRSAIRDIRTLPELAAAAVSGLDSSQLETPYRPQGWTVRQVVHHLADSHINAYVRLRLALTEDRPTIRPYDEKRWAELPDARELDVASSLAILSGVHERWSHLLDSLGSAELERPLVHPESGTLTIAQLTGSYGWHCRHHVAHITSLRMRMGWD